MKICLILKHVFERSTANPHLSPLLSITAEYMLFSWDNQFSFHHLLLVSATYKTAIWWLSLDMRNTFLLRGAYGEGNQTKRLFQAKKVRV